VVVEIDGSSHDDKQEYDAQRDAYLEGLGLTVIHIDDRDIKKKLAFTINWLLEHPAFNTADYIGQQPAANRGSIEPPRSSTTPPKEGNLEPASELLKRIKAEKARLIKEGEIKKEKPLLPITEDEIPFELPEGWVWCRLGEILLYSDSGKSPDCIKRPANQDEWGVLTTTSIQKGLFLEDANKVLPRSFKVNLSQQVNSNDILITRAGPLNRTGICCKVDKINTNLILSDKTIRLKHPDEFIQPDYLVAILNSTPIRKLLIPKMTGMAESQVNISQGNLKTTLIPIAPFKEQVALIKKLELIFLESKKLESEITQSEQYAQMLMQAVLKEAFESKKEAVSI
jgi:type I restriction enzyme S subunit